MRGHTQMLSALRETQLEHYAEHKPDAAEIKTGLAEIKARLAEIVRRLEEFGGDTTGA